MTDRDAFIEQVERQLPPGLEAVSADIPEVVAWLVDCGLVDHRYPQQHIKNVVQFLGRWYVHKKGRISDNPEAVGEVIESRINANALLNGEFLAEMIKPQIKAIRNDYFGSEEPPFASLEDAEQWYAPIEKELMRSTHDLVVMGYLPRDLEYTTEAAERWWTRVERPLMRLSHEVGVEQTSLIFYVLADIKPLTVPYEITMPGREYCKGRRRCYYVNVKINTELGFNELFDIHRTVKDSLGVKRGRRFDQQHLELHTMVQERGGVPTKGVKKFWESLLQEWDARHPGMYKEWRSIKRAYDRLSSKLNSQYQIGGEQ